MDQGRYLNDFEFPDLLISDEQILPDLPFENLSPTPIVAPNSYGGQYFPSEVTPSYLPQRAHSNAPNPNAYPPNCNFPEDGTQQIKVENEQQQSSAYNDSQLPAEDSNVNLSQYMEKDPSSPSNQVLSSPLFYLSLTAYPGPYNFTVNIPKTSQTGAKPKWCYSHVTNKLYAAKMVTFPINIKMESYPLGASIMICPIYSEISARTIPVTRCYLCQIKDVNEQTKDHVLQVVGSSPQYFSKDDRNMVAIPLDQPAVGDDDLQIYVKMCCNTSCVGGPNRKPFSILLTLVLHNAEVGRQVIHTKCCEGPVRDMTKDEADFFKASKTERDQDVEAVKRMASEIGSNKIEMRKNKKRRITVQSPRNRGNSYSAEDYMMVPIRFQKKVKRFVNLLYLKEQTIERNLQLKKLYPNESDSD